MMSDIHARKHMWSGPRDAWSMFRLYRTARVDHNYEYKSQHPHNLHCGCVPSLASGRTEKLDAWIKYYGYENEAGRRRKHAFYSKADPRLSGFVKRFGKTKQSEFACVNWRDDISCREIGLHNTVRY